MRACASFASRLSTGRCAGCGRRLPLREGYCRLCWCQARLDAETSDPAAGVRPFLSLVSSHQLFLAHLTPLWGRKRREGTRIRNPGGRIGRPPKPVPIPAARPPSPGTPLRLFDLPRDYSRFDARDRLDLDDPLMAWARWTIHIIGEARGWKRGVRDDIEYGLAVLLANRGDGEPVLHSEMFPFLRTRVIGVGRTTDVLKRMGMFRDDRRPSFEDWLTGKLDGLAPGISRDVEAWLRILHDGGPRNKARAPATVWGYMNRIQPILLTWSDRYDHLREITRDDVEAALDQLHGHQRRHALISLRSLFARAKKNGAIFRDPTRGFKVGQHQYGVLQPLLSDDIDQSIQTAKTPAARVMVALAGVHAARAVDMLALRLDDIDLGNRRIIIGGRVRPLDDLTHQLLSDWLCHRQDRWPDTANPHLLINHKTALTTVPASGKGASLILHRQAATLERLRMDRILEEALACGGDPLHLASVFGLDTKTAIRYADSARELLTTRAEEQDPAHSAEPKG
ncbi:hypothetical protein [Sphaerisporangium fuscum]|uniref:hypothetical protein n=1 Tax=Sphaerisporangium fuscum TaxID=2835868 RepID=UPI001BDC70E7|nr:hypothetical protein [Sphaerisporangium fuscum]